MERKMRKENPDTCRGPPMAAPASTNLSSDSPVSHFISITMRGLGPKLRIKIPNLLLKTMHGKFHNDSHNRRAKEGRVFSNALGNEKSPAKSLFNGEKSDLASEDGEETSISSNNSMPILDEILSETFSADERNQKREEKMPEKKDLPLMISPDKKKDRSFIKAKMKTSRREKRSFGSRPMVMVKKLKMIRESLQNKVKKRFARDDKKGEEEEEDGELLWKKKILMGGRCKPLKDDLDV